jgi:hypothetical protein
MHIPSAKEMPEGGRGFPGQAKQEKNQAESAWAGAAGARRQSGGAADRPGTIRNFLINSHSLRKILFGKEQSESC